MKKERELAHLLCFKEVCSFFPEGRIEPTERPDFVVHASTGLLGIEHTEVFQPGLPHGGSIQAQESLRKRVVSRAKDFYTRSCSLLLHVYVFFNRGIEIKKQDTANMAKVLAQLVGEASPGIGKIVKLEPTWETWKNFPEEIAYILIHRDKRYKGSDWIAVSAGFVPSIAPEDIQARIEAKESKLDDYKTRCSEVWLVIVADEFQVSSTVNLARPVMEHGYATEFDRVFFFCNYERKFFEFKLIKDTD